MAARRSPQELAQISAFIRVLYDRGGYARWSEFAADAHVHPVSLSKWQNGEVEPSGYNLLALISAANARTPGDEATRPLPAETEDAPNEHALGLLKELADSVDLLRQSVEAAISTGPAGEDAHNPRGSRRRAS